VAVPVEVKGRIDYLYKDDKNNIEPRVGFAWSPGFNEGFLGKVFGGPGNSSIRGGYGIYDGRIFQSVFSQGGAGLRFNPPNAFQYNQTSTTAAPSSLFAPNNLADPTKGFVFVPGPQSTRHSITIVDSGLEMPYTQQWNLSLERQMPFNSALRISYTGNRGIGLLRFAQGNLPAHDPVNGVLVADHPNNPANLRGQVIKVAANAECAGTNGTTVLFTPQCPSVVAIGAFEYSLRVPRTNERRPDGRYSTNLLVSNASWSYYNSMQVEWTKKLSEGFNFQTTYTFSKAIDTTSEATDVGVASGDTNQTGNLSRNARGLSLFHTPHRFTFYGTYRLPFFNGRRDLLGETLGGWQIATVVRLASGTPFTVRNTAGVDLNFDSFIENRPVILDPSILGRVVDHPSTSQSALPRSAFRTATLADFGNGVLGRNTFFRDGQRVVDIGLTKYFEMPFEGHRLMLRADLFNAFNHVWYGTPVTDIAASNFGAITGTHALYTPRTVQIALRYTF
jgi:hypothetical protein